MLTYHVGPLGTGRWWWWWGGTLLAEQVRIAIYNKNTKVMAGKGSISRTAHVASTCSHVVSPLCFRPNSSMSRGPQALAWFLSTSCVTPSLFSPSICFLRGADESRCLGTPLIELEIPERKVEALLMKG